jgi:hypothetical protein
MADIAREGPMAAMRHMGNPAVMTKVQKMLAAMQQPPPPS